MLEGSFCTSKGCSCRVSTEKPGRPPQERAERLSGKTPHCGSAKHWGSQTAPRHPGKQHPKQPQPESLLCAVERTHGSRHLFCLYILRETSRPGPKIATDRNLLFSRPENLYMEASDLFPKYLKNRERKQNTANPHDATQGNNSPHQQHSCPTALRSTSTHISTSSALHCKVCNPLTFTPKGFQFILNLTLWDTSSPQSQLKLL